MNVNIILMPFHTDFCYYVSLDIDKEPISNNMNREYSFHFEMEFDSIYNEI